jgi:hypothetical protein
VIVNVSRSARSQAAMIGTATSSATAVRLEDAAGGVVSVGPLTASISVSMHCGWSENNVAALVDGGALQTLTMAASPSAALYALPDSLFGARYLRLVAASETACTVTVKS